MSIWTTQQFIKCHETMSHEATEALVVDKLHLPFSGVISSAPPSPWLLYLFILLILVCWVSSSAPLDDYILSYLKISHLCNCVALFLFNAMHYTFPLLMPIISFVLNLLTMVPFTNLLEIKNMLAGSSAPNYVDSYDRLFQFITVNIFPDSEVLTWRKYNKHRMLRVITEKVKYFFRFIKYEYTRTTSL